MTSSLAEIIRRRRTELGLSQAELGERVGRTGSTVRRWERGETVPARALAASLAAALDVATSELPMQAITEAPSAEDAAGDEADNEGMDGLPPAAAPRDVTDLPTELAPIPVVSSSDVPAMAAAADSIPRRRLGLTRLRSPQPSYVGRGYIEDRRQRLRYWLRYLLTAVVLFIGVIVLFWAFGELWEALGDVWNLFGEEPPETTALGTDF